MLYFTWPNPHIIYAVIVFLTVFSIRAIFTKQDFIKKNKNSIFIVATVLLVWSQFSRYIGGRLDEGFDITEDLPFFICRLSSVVLTYYVITKDKRVESFLFYWGATGLAGIIYPNGPISNIVNLTETFYIDHFLLTLTPFFLIVYQGYRPSKRDLFTITGVMFAILVAFIPINSLLGADYFYLIDQSVVGILIPGLPSIVFAMLHTMIAFGFFGGLYLYFKDKEFTV